MTLTSLSPNCDRMLNQKKTDHRFMALALMLGRQGLGRVAPNPSVGCVIVQSGQIVGRGRTADGGRPHAEVVALAQAGNAAAGATAYVTLEPCAHHGQTGPCAQALVQAGVVRVVVATTDPNPLVSGAGLQMLRDAGIEVLTGVLEPQAKRDHAGFFLTQTDNRPYVTLKLASSLDGRIATSSGHSQWITGSEARRMVHAMRARHDAVMVGGGTVRADDPTLNVRDLGVTGQPARVIVSNSAIRAPNLQTAAQDVTVYHCHGPKVAPADWVTGISCPETAGAVDLHAALKGLADHGLTRIFCEGGGTLGASLLAAGLVDEVVCFDAGIAIGGDGLAGLATLGVTDLNDAPRFDLAEHRRVGADVMHRWVRRPI